MTLYANSITNQLTQSPIDADFLVDTPITGQEKTPPSSQILNCTPDESPHSPPLRLNDYNRQAFSTFRSPSARQFGGRLQSFVTNNIAQPVETTLIPPLKSGAHHLLTAPAKLASTALCSLGNLVGGQTQTQMKTGAEQLDKTADRVASWAVNACTQLASPKNLVQAACLASGKIYGSPMSGLALLSAVQAAQGEALDAKLIANNAIQAYMTESAENISTIFGAGIVGAVISGAAASATIAATSAAIESLNRTNSTPSETTANAIMGATVRGAVSAGLEKAVDDHLTRTSASDTRSVALGKQTLRNGIVGAGNTLTANLHEQLSQSGKLSPQKLLASTRESLGNSVVNTLAKFGIKTEKNKAAPTHDLA